MGVDSAGLVGSVDSCFDSEFHFHDKFWINLGHHIYPKYSHPMLFTIYFSSTSPFYYLCICVKLLGECQTV